MLRNFLNSTRIFEVGGIYELAVSIERTIHDAMSSGKSAFGRYKETIRCFAVVSAFLNFQVDTNQVKVLPKMATLSALIACLAIFGVVCESNFVKLLIRKEI